MVTKRNYLNLILLVFVTSSRLFCMEDFRLASKLTAKMLSSGPNPIIPVIGGALALGGAATYLKYHLPRSTREESKKRSTRSTIFIQAVEKHASDTAMQQDRQNIEKPFLVSDVMEKVFSNPSDLVFCSTDEKRDDTTPLSILNSTADTHLKKSQSSHLLSIMDIEDSENMIHSCPTTPLSFNVGFETDDKPISQEQIQSARIEIAEDLQILNESKRVLQQFASKKEQLEASKKIVAVYRRHLKRKHLREKLKAQSPLLNCETLQSNSLEMADPNLLGPDEEITDSEEESISTKL